MNDSREVFGSMNYNSITNKLSWKINIFFALKVGFWSHYSASCHIFKQFATDWNFKHVTSSPRYAQSNGFIERQVQTVKLVMSKAKKSRQEIQKALLCIRTTPIDSMLPSPAELLYGKKIRGNMPMKISNPLPNKDNIADRLVKRQEQQKQYHDRNAHEQSPLHTGQNVRIQDGKKWAPGIVVNKRPEPRSYEVSTQNGNILRRNRRHLKEMGKRTSINLNPTKSKCCQP